MHEQEPRSQRPAPKRRLRGSQDHGADRQAAGLRLLGALQKDEAGRVGAAAIKQGGMLRTWAGALGNRALGQLVRADRPTPADAVAARSPGLSESYALDRSADGALDLESGPTPGVAAALTAAVSPDLVQRAPRRTNLAVSLSFDETAMQPYELNSETMQGIDEELPADVGQFNHVVVPTWSTKETDTGADVTAVRLPVQYNYIMPEWTRLSEQPRVVRQAWQRFYGDVMTHEREHLSVCRRYYTELQRTLQALPPEERSESRVQQEIDTSIERQNEVHRSHAGFATPATIVFSDYIPESERESEGGAEGGPEAAPE